MQVDVSGLEKDDVVVYVANAIDTYVEDVQECYQPPVIRGLQGFNRPAFRRCSSASSM